MKILLVGNSQDTRRLHEAWQRDPNCILEWHPRPPSIDATQNRADLVLCEDSSTHEIRLLISRTLREPDAQPLALLYHPPRPAGHRQTQAASTVPAAAWPLAGARILEFHAPVRPRRGIAG
jgi:hypothetical protein